MSKKDQDEATLELFIASIELIEFVMDRYNLDSADELTCPYMKRLSDSVDKVLLSRCKQ